MKVCEVCGEDIDGTKDADNRCPACEFIEDDNRTEKATARKKKANADRRMKESALRSLGLVKVKGALGGTYWE